MMSVSVAGIPKNRCRTTIPERMGETRAELPFTADQVGLFRAQPGRPKRACRPRSAAFAKNRGPEATVSRPLSHDACALLGPLCLTPRLPLLASSLTVSIRGRTYCLAGGPGA